MIKKASINNIKNIHKLLTQFGTQGELLPRPLSELYDHLRDFFVYTDKSRNNKTIKGCCALQICWENIAEVRSLAVLPEFQGEKIGSKLVMAAINNARSLEIKKVFTLTYKPEFFKNFGFNIISKKELPLKIWGECIHCVKFPDCDETAMIKIL